MAGIEPANLILTKDALYRLSYISARRKVYHLFERFARGVGRELRNLLIRQGIG